MAENLIYYNSRWRYALLTLISLVFVATGVWLISRDGLWSTGLAATVFFGGCAAVGIWQFVDSRPRLQLTDDGILDRTLGIGLIRWVDIDGAYLQSIRNQNFICLELRNEDEYLQRLSPLRRKLTAANEALGFTPLSINLSGVNLNPEEVMEYILKQSAAAQMGRPNNSAS